MQNRGVFKGLAGLQWKFAADGGRKGINRSEHLKSRAVAFFFLGRTQRRGDVLAQGQDYHEMLFSPVRINTLVEKYGFSKSMVFSS